MGNIKEAVSFFKSEKAYQTLFQQFRKKYESLGRIGGTVPVRLFSHEEIEQLASFFGMSAHQLQASPSISLQTFEKQLQKTRFEGLELKELLDAYFGETIISKKQSKLNQEKALQNLYSHLKLTYPELDFWFKYIQLNIGENRWINQLAKNEPNKFQLMIKHLAKSMRSLPTTAERLPMFSQRMTGDPHAFDLDQDLGKLLLHVLAVHSTKINEDVHVPTSTEAINELLQEYNIYRDDLLNFVTCANLVAETADGIHPAIKAAADQHMVQNIPLRELIPLEKVYPAFGKDVWIVENSGVCSALLDVRKEIPIICTNGQFKLAALIIMDRLIEAGCTLHYAGDFDPEGLRMAQNLLNRYPEHARLWRMDLLAYQKSNPTKKLTTERLEKLNGIQNEKLQAVAEKMKQIKKAGYQEALVQEMLQDIMCNFQK